MTPELQKIVDKFWAVVHDELKQRGIVTMMEKSEHEAFEAALRTALAEGIEAVRPEPAVVRSMLDIGSEFATPRDYKAIGFNAAIVEMEEQKKKLLGEDGEDGKI